MRRFVLGLSLLGLAAPAHAHQNPQNVEVRVERIAPGVAVLFGAGGNIGLSYGQDGNVIIDDQFAPLTDRIVAAVASVDPDPIRFVINTHWHFDHTGGNENFGRRGAVIVAHDNVRRRMSAEQMLLGELRRPSPTAALPVVTFAQGVTFHLNGDTIQVRHVEHAHTDGDALVYWQRANVLHMGDTFFNGALPFIDLESGGSVDGVLRAVETALAMSNAGTRIIPGHGPVATRSDLVAYRNRIRSIRGRVAAEIARGRTLAQIQALGIANAHGKATDFVPPARFVETVFNSLRRPAHR
jgi:glyoxylase-like metal-dependent hydrolase (beta-lactamase superfamily II)